MTGPILPAGAAQPGEAPAATLVCCGLIGTVVADTGLVEQAFTEAIATQGVVPGTSAYARSMAIVHRTRGQATGAVMSAVFPENQVRAQAAHLAFDRSLGSAVDRMGVSPVPGAREVLAQLAATGLRVCLLTGLSARLLSLVLADIGGPDLADLVLSGDDAPRGWPFPDLLLAAMLRLGVADVREAVMVDCTGDGVLAGRRAGASLAVGVLTGPHSRERLRRDGASHVVDSIAGVGGVIGADRVPGEVHSPRRVS